MNAAQYEEHVSRMPKNHQSTEWLDWLIAEEARNGRSVEQHDHWIKVQNIKYHREIDLGSIKLKNTHYVYFLKGSFSSEAMVEMAAIMRDMSGLGFSCYVNRKSSMTIDRFHFHAVNRGISGLISGLLESL